MSKDSRYEKNYYDVRGDGKVILYQRPDVISNPKWQCRVSVDGATGSQRFSTKTASRDDAERIALDRYFELKHKVDKGGTLQGKTVKQVFQEWESYIKVQLSNREVELIEKNTTSVVANSLIKFLGKKRIDSLRNSDIQDMISWRFTDEMYNKSFKSANKGQSTKSQSKVRHERYSASTLKNYRGAINQFFKYCKDREYITRDLTFDIPKGKSNPRPEFSKDDWRKLTTYMRKWVDEETNFIRGKSYKSPKIHRSRLYLQNYILILGNTGIRVGEARTLRWIDIQPITIENNEERLVLEVEGKTGRRSVIANAGTENYFKRLFDYRLQEVGTSKEDFNYNEPIFCHEDGKSVESYKKGYVELLNKCNLRITPNGDYRTIYSLRHTYATMRINEVPIYQLSVNMGTSVKMIEEYYSHARVKSSDFATTITKGNQKGSSKVLPW